MKTTFIVNKDKKEQPLDTNLVKTYLNNVNALNLGTYVTYNATDEELAKYGLDEPQYNLEVKYTPKSEDSSEDSGDSTDSKHLYFMSVQNRTTKPMSESEIPRLSTRLQKMNIRM